jgi:uncharacterized protein YdaU (DUF1376 family)
MTYIERGLYRELLDECWAEGFIPNDIDQMADICGCPVEVMASAWQVLSKCFELSDGVYVNERIEHERTDRDSIRANRARAGHQGGLSKSLKNKDDESISQADAKQVLASASKCHIEEKRREEKENSKEKKPMSADADLLAVFDHWRTRMNHPNAKLDDKRKKLIVQALKLGYTPADLIAAIDGCAKSPFHMGQNDRSTVYDGLDLILRDASKIDHFIKLNSQPVPAGGTHAAHHPGLTGTAARNAAVSKAIRDLRTGADGAGQTGGAGHFRDHADSDAIEVFSDVPDAG